MKLSHYQTGMWPIWAQFINHAGDASYKNIYRRISERSVRQAERKVTRELDSSLVFPYRYRLGEAIESLEVNP